MSFNIGAFFTAAWPWIKGALVLIVVVAVAMLILWLVSGRNKKGGEDSLDRVLRPMAFMKGHQNTGGGGSGRSGVR